MNSWPDQVDDRGHGEQVLLTFANLCLAALNLLEQGMPGAPGPTTTRVSCTAAQHAVHLHVCTRVICRLDAALGATFNHRGAFLKNEGAAAKTSYECIRGNDVDLPATAATCDPSQLVDLELWNQMCHANNLFPAGQTATGSAGVPRSCCVERRPYVKLTSRELRCKKLRLQLRARGCQSFRCAEVHQGSPAKNLGRLRSF